MPPAHYVTLLFYRAFTPSLKLTHRVWRHLFISWRLSTQDKTTIEWQCKCKCTYQSTKYRITILKVFDYILRPNRGYHTKLEAFHMSPILRQRNRVWRHLLVQNVFWKVFAEIGCNSFIHCTVSVRVDENLPERINNFESEFTSNYISRSTSNVDS